MNINTPIQLAQTHTDNVYQPPEESLNVISNYSSLERMYQKTTPAGRGLQKKESFRIAGWESNSKEKKHSGKSKSRFRREEGTVHLTIATERITREEGRKKQWTASSKEAGMSTPKRERHRSLPQGMKEVILGTNFKYGVKPSFGKKEQWTTFSPLPVSPRSQKLRQKAKIVEMYRKQSLLRRGSRGIWPFNPECDYLATTQYPILADGMALGRRSKRQAFLRHFGI